MVLLLNPLKQEKDFLLLKEVLFALPKRNKNNNKIEWTTYMV
jgi:hypothetical protein